MQQSSLFTSEYLKDHIFDLRRKIAGHDLSWQLRPQLKQLLKFKPEKKLGLNGIRTRAMHWYRRDHAFESLAGMNYLQA